MELFIEKVKNYPCLWDMRSVLYRDIGRKEMIWEIVAKECGITNAKDAKSQWKKLRDSHREALRRRKTTTGQGAKKIHPWRYERQMEFLLPQVVDNGETFSNYSNQTAQENNPPNVQSETIPEEPSRDSSPNEFGVPITTKRRNKTIVDILEERENKRACRERERDELRRQALDRLQGTHDALSDLFSSMCQKTRQLPKYLQLRVQREIFDSVTRAEEEALSYELSSPNSAPYSISSASAYSSDIYRYPESPSPGTSVEPDDASKQLTTLT